MLPGRNEGKEPLAFVPLLDSSGLTCLWRCFALYSLAGEAIGSPSAGPESSCAEAAEDEGVSGSCTFPGVAVGCSAGI